VGGVVAEEAEGALGHTEIADVVCVALEGNAVVPAGRLAGLGAVLSEVAEGANSDASVGALVCEGPL
jgi:hypothetical protein